MAENPGLQRQPSLRSRTPRHTDVTFPEGLFPNTPHPAGVEADGEQGKPEGARGFFRTATQTAQALGDAAVRLSPKAADAAAAAVGGKGRRWKAAAGLGLAATAAGLGYVAFAPAPPALPGAQRRGPAIEYHRKAIPEDGDDATAAVAARAFRSVTTCWVHTRGACYDVGYVDQIASPAMCALACWLNPACKWWDLHQHRADKRCHFCSVERKDWSTCQERWNDASLGDHERCAWGSEACGEEDDALSLEELLAASVAYAQGLAAGTRAADGDETYEQAVKLNGVLTEWAKAGAAGFAAPATRAQADAAAAALTYDPAGDCDANALWTNLRALVLFADTGAGSRNGARAFAGLANAEGRRRLFEDHGVFVADANFLNADSVEALVDLYAGLPRHLFAHGILHDVAFATLTVGDAYVCAGDRRASSLLTTTSRGFNVFSDQAGQGAEEAFAGTSVRRSGDFLLTVTRHETAHQFDRALGLVGNALDDLWEALRQNSDQDLHFPRAAVGAAFFAAAPGEIVASNVGNQYMLDSAAVFRHARAEAAAGNYFVLSWFLFAVELFAGDGASSRFFSEAASRKATTIIPVNVGFKGGRLDRLAIPGCGLFEFAYSSYFVTSYTGPAADCVPDASRSPPPVEATPRPSFRATPRPSPSPTPRPVPAPPPLDVTTPRPTPYPVPPGCANSGIKKPVVIKSGAKKKCSWLNSKPGQCAKQITARLHCPATCGLCFMKDNNARKAVRNVGGTRRAKKDCPWVRKKWEDRCSKFPAARQQCRVTCNTIAGCDDQPGNVVETPAGPQSCAWVAGDWFQRCVAYPTAEERCPVTCGSCSCTDKPGTVVDLDGDDEPDQKCKWVGKSPDARCAMGNANRMCPITCDACGQSAEALTLARHARAVVCGDLEPPGGTCGHPSALATFDGHKQCRKWKAGGYCRRSCFRAGAPHDDAHCA